jgi:hypothetical protein
MRPASEKPKRVWPSEEEEPCDNKLKVINPKSAEQAAEHLQRGHEKMHTRKVKHFLTKKDRHRRSLNGRLRPPQANNSLY